MLLGVDVPDDGAVGMELWERQTLIGRLDDPALGHDLRYDARLEPGDYQVWLRPITPSEGDYRLDVERGDPFATDPDIEPNDTVLAARPMPASLAFVGTGRTPRGEDDWFALPPLVADGAVRSKRTGMSPSSVFPTGRPSSASRRPGDRPADVPTPRDGIAMVPSRHGNGPLPRQPVR